MSVIEKSKVQSALPIDALSDLNRIRRAVDKREEKVRNLALGYRKDRLIGRFSVEDIAEGLFAAICEERDLPVGESHDDWAGLVDEYLRRNPVDPDSMPGLTLDIPLRRNE